MWLLLALLPYHYAPSLQISVKNCYSINSALNKKKLMLPTKYRARTFINQLVKRLYWVSWGLTPLGPVKWWCGTSICWFHIRSFPFYGINTKLFQLSIFHGLIKCYDKIFFLFSRVEFQCQVNNDTSTPCGRQQPRVRQTLPKNV